METDFYEPDEPVEKVEAAWAGVKQVDLVALRDLAEHAFGYHSATDLAIDLNECLGVHPEVIMARVRKALRR